jgi:hypothetical protein
MNGELVITGEREGGVVVDLFRETERKYKNLRYKSGRAECVVVGYLKFIVVKTVRLT